MASTRLARWPPRFSSQNVEYVAFIDRAPHLRHLTPPPETQISLADLVKPRGGGYWIGGGLLSRYPLILYCWLVLENIRINFMLRNTFIV